MGGNGSTTRKVSFGLDEDEKVTVIEGVKLSADVLRRMRESDIVKTSPSMSDSHEAPKSPKSTGSSSTEIQEEMRKDFERQQALVQEQLARLAQREKETAVTRGFDELMPSLIMERGKAHEEHEKSKILARAEKTLPIQQINAKQLERKERELVSISSFYKDQLEVLEKKNFDIYKESAEQYNQAATKAEAHVRPRQTAAVCADLQAEVLRCYRDNPQQTLHCSGLAKQFMTCVQQAKKSPLTNHG